MYGSSLTRLQIPDSDVDFVIESLDDDHMTLLYRIKDVIKVILMYLIRVTLNNH